MRNLSALASVHFEPLRIICFIGGGWGQGAWLRFRGVCHQHNSGN